jgi:hypothetical protein
MRIKGLPKPSWRTAEKWIPAFAGMTTLFLAACLSAFAQPCFNLALPSFRGRDGNLPKCSNHAGNASCSF